MKAKITITVLYILAMIIVLSSNNTSVAQSQSPVSPINPAWQATCEVYALTPVPEWVIAIQAKLTAEAKLTPTKTPIPALASFEQKLDTLWWKNETTACAMWTDGARITRIDCR